MREKYLKLILDLDFQIGTELENITRIINEGLPSEKRQRFYYEQISERNIPGYILREARKAFEYSRNKLGLKNLRLKWWQRSMALRRHYEFDCPVYGQADTVGGNEIGVRWDIPLKEVKYTILHEAFHLWFKKTRGNKYPIEKEADYWEETADVWARKAMLDLGIEGLKKEKKVEYPIELKMVEEDPMIK